jgi:hypothetical protein
MTTLAMIPLGALMVTGRLALEPGWFIRDAAYRFRSNKDVVRAHRSTLMYS